MKTFVHIESLRHGNKRDIINRNMNNQIASIASDKSSNTMKTKRDRKCRSLLIRRSRRLETSAIISTMNPMATKRNLRRSKEKRATGQLNHESSRPAATKSLLFLILLTLTYLSMKVSPACSLSPADETAAAAAVATTIYASSTISPSTHAQSTSAETRQEFLNNNKSTSVAEGKLLYEIEQQPVPTFSPPLAKNTPVVIQKSDANLAVPTDVPSQQAVASQVAAPTKAAPVLRPSIEEVASELSRKHLNLEHENWRLKQSSSSSATSYQQQQQQLLQQHQDAQRPQLTRPETHLAGEAEQEIVMTSVRNSSGIEQTGETPSHEQTQEMFFDDNVTTRNQAPRHTVVSNSGTENVTAYGGSVINQALNKQHQNSHRRKKANIFFQQQQSSYEDSELHQCHQYLHQHHSSPFQSTSGPMSSARLASSQPLPCSCELRRHFSSELSTEPSTWLSCDNVQLIGSHIYTRGFNGNERQQRNVDNINTDYLLRGSPVGDRDDDVVGGLMVTRFSQRDSGLQTLHAQKFHYLKLFNLKSIDLSDNRIRHIKMDAFHGLETKLEQLNLAKNLLGDSRAIFDNNNNNAQSSGDTKNNNNLHKSHSGKLIFLSDELNRLRKLKWLSLRNNQINQLGSTIFVTKQHQTSNADARAPSSVAANSRVDTTTSAATGGAVTLESQGNSELLYLDLSENLLKFIPSDSIYLLNKLQTLNLGKNRISQLDQFSKFPESVKYLDLSKNLIKNVRQCNLIDMPNLIEINLSHNQLSHLDKTAFISSAFSGLHLSSANSQNNLLLSPTSSLQEEKQLSHSVDDQSSVSYGDHLNIENHGTSVSNEESGDESTRERSRRKRAAIESKGNNGIIESQPSSSSHEDDDEIEADESVFSSITNQVNSRQTISDELNSIQPMNQFNSTIKLNLSYNFFEHIPGDSLLKFSNLQTLDLSFNRIRRLDSNYLCSIYNLVDSLKFLDLSGNLLVVAQQQNTNSTEGNVRQLNKLFGCLQKLEKLLLSTNRLTSVERFSKGASTESANESGSQQAGFSVVASQQTASEYDDQQASSTGSNNGSSSNSTNNANGGEEFNLRDVSGSGSGREERLTIRFSESFGNRHLNTLDLSDNQLKSMPIIEQLSPQPTTLLMNLTHNVSSNSSANNITNRQLQLNQWMSSCIYLEVLNLNHNYLERLEEHEFEHLFNLRELYLDFNKLSLLPVGLMRRFTSLDRLSLNGNKISSLDPLNELLERSVRTLRVLNLANNRLLEWPQMNKRMIKQETTYNQQEFNHRSQEFERSASSGGDGDGSRQQQQLLSFALEELNLEGNLFTSNNVSSLFDQLVHMRSLRVLNLSYNLLNRIMSQWFKFADKNLQKLVLTGNKINNIELGAFASNQVNELTQLSLDYNLLKELKRKTFDSMPKLRELNLAFNLIHTINSETFHQVNSLRILKLNNNKLTSWKCEYFSHLCNSLTGNINADLATLLSSDLLQQQQQQQQQPTSNLNDERQQQSNQHYAIMPPSTVSSLVELDLSHNSLSQLRTNSISVHTKLVRLNLAHNKLSFIPHDLFKATTSGSKTTRQIQLVSSLKYLNLAHNRIQTIDNINFRPLKNLVALDLSFNELQTLGVDVILMDSKHLQQEQSNRKIVVSNNLTNLPANNDEILGVTTNQTSNGNLLDSATNWPSLSKLRHLNLAHNQLTVVNQSLLSELSPFALLNLNLSSNYLESEALPNGFYSKISGASNKNSPTPHTSNNSPHSQQDPFKQTTYDLVFALKLESLDLSLNRLNEYPTNLLDVHYTSMESCNLSHNRIQSLLANSNLMLQIKKMNLEFNPLNRDSNELILFEQHSVRYLNLAATRLYAIQQATMATDQGLHSGLTSAQLKHRIANQTSELDLIRSISKPIDAPYLRHLNLSSNQLVWLAANVFDKMHSLQTLDLSNNQLTRLHLLNNQLSHVSSTLEYLSMSSNLFTTIDSNDFSQLTTLRHLDLSNLLNLQKINCKFLSRLTTLRSLKMFNYPQLRQSLNTIISSLNSYSSNSDGNQPQHLDRLQRKLRQELIMSTIGQHCFREEPLDHSTMGSVFVRDSLDESEIIDSARREVNVKSFDLHELELELFNNFITMNSKSGGGFVLRNELSQLLGPHTRKLTLIGLNLTSLGEDSLLGVTNDELKLKISYTSMSKAPLRQILNSVAKRTKLNLDFRNNNIQTIDLRGLQLLDELQLNNQVLQHGDHSSLRLGFNPIRCDCHTRPLWLWLNQRWANVDLPQGSDEQIGDTSTANNANYWLKFNSVSQTSDLKCYYPLKLRGKLTQHVYYNDLVCKGGNSLSSSQGATSRQNRKRTETRFGDSYYLTSNYNGDSASNSELDTDLDEDDYVDSPTGDQLKTPDGGGVVKVTRFNRYRQNLNNRNFLFINNAPVPFLLDKEPEVLDDEQIRIGKRDHNSNPASTGSPIENNGQSSGSKQAASSMNINYSKHRPNTQQRHQAHFDTLSPFNNLPIGKAIHSRHSQINTKHSMLTESDVMILTVISIAMIVMAFVIIGICLFKYKMDKSDKEQILSTHSKLMMSQAMFMDSPSPLTKGKKLRNVSGSGGGSKSNQSHSSKSSSSASSSKHSKRTSDLLSGGKSLRATSDGSGSNKSSQKVSSKLQPTVHTNHKHCQHKQSYLNQQVLVPIGHSAGPLVGLTAVPAPNFLMRSPTIRRMHGLASNASDWFKFTLRAYPPNKEANRRRRLFLSGTEQIPSASSCQLTTAKLKASSTVPSGQISAKLLPANLASGCPSHGFRCIQRLRNPTGLQPKPPKQEQDQCSICNRLLVALQQTKVQFPIRATQDEASSSSSDRNSAELSSKQQQHQKRAKSTHPAPDGQPIKVPSSSSDESQSAGGLEQGCYIPPKLMKALVEQLDQQQEKRTMADWKRANGKPMSVYQTREQQVKSMRTFGVNARASAPASVGQASEAEAAARRGYLRGQRMHVGDEEEEDAAAAAEVAVVVAATNDLHLQSQIPAAHVDGRFAYQTESQMESPAYEIQADQYDMKRDTPLSHQTSNPDDIFILVRDETQSNPSSHRSDEPMECRATKNIVNGQVAEKMRRHHHQYHHHHHHHPTTTGSDGGHLDDSCARGGEDEGCSAHEKETFQRPDSVPNSSVMNDECSHSSSPVAYGFMRSSPLSATTLSSHTTVTHSHYVVNSCSDFEANNSITTVQGCNSSMYAHAHNGSSAVSHSTASTTGTTTTAADGCGGVINGTTNGSAFLTTYGGNHQQNNNNYKNGENMALIMDESPVSMIGGGPTTATAQPSSLAAAAEEQIIISRL